MKKFMEKFKKGGIAVNCSTEEKAKAFLKACKEEGLEWYPGMDLERTTFYNKYGTNTCYECQGNGVLYCDFEYFKNEGFTVVSFDVIEKDPTKERIFGHMLEGVYAQAFDEFKNMYEVGEEEAEVMEQIVGIIQLIVNIEKLPLKLEIDKLKHELNEARKEASELKIKANALEESNKKLTIENRNLINSLKYMKEVSVNEDKIEAI